MGRGGKTNDTLEELGVSQDTIKEMRLSAYEKEEEWSRQRLTKTFAELNIVLGRNDKVKKDTLSDLVYKVCTLAEMVKGMYEHSELQRKGVADRLNDTLRPYREELSARETEPGKKEQALAPSRDDVVASYDAVFRIKLQQIILNSLVVKK
ncbi:MAG: hypothetical protein WC523_04160 [Patescibacteria group bacterium]